MPTDKRPNQNDSINARLSRIEVRLDEVFEPALRELLQNSRSNAYVSRAEMSEFESDIKDLKKVTRNSPIVEKVVFALVGLVLTTVVIALLYLVVNRGAGA